jgi:multidrug efflux system outer membrane protein
VQQAFADVSNALARRGTINDQRGAQDRLVAAAQRSLTLSDEQYKAGTQAYINVLTAQRTLYTARQTQVSATLADLSNRLALYTAIGADDTL